MMTDQFLAEAQAAAQALDLAYNEAELSDQVALKPTRDAAFDRLSAARRCLVSAQIVVTSEDAAGMKTIRVEIEAAGDTQALALCGAKLVAALAKHVALA